MKKDPPIALDRGRDPIAIIGIGCRYPGASGPAELWKNLLASRENVGPYSDRRFADLDRLYEETRRKAGRLFTDRGGFLSGIDGFDAQFFEISPRESIYIDPQHRLLLEVAWEALEDAGQIRERYEGSATGVYTGLWTNEYESRLYESGTENDFYSVTGCGRASASGRLSFTFGFQGPSVTVDSACSSSLVAVHMACQALWANEIEMALAGGANLILGPEISELFTKAKMLSPHGSCRFGDALASGFVRSEGAGIVVLKRLSRAVADNDPIYAVIRGGAVNNDGRSSGLLVTPSRAGQREMLHAAWESAGIEPGELSYIEMHGTGTSVGDPVEIEAVGVALADAGVTQSCALGSIKTNIGHTESAAGVAGLIKTALSLKHRMIPPSLHFETPNPKIAWDRMPVHVAAKIVDLSGKPGRIIAGVNSFGITGTNAHLVLEETDRRSRAAEPESGPYLLPISARSPEALNALLRQYREDMRAAGAGYPLRDACYTAGARRNHHEYRTAIVGHDLQELEKNLTAAIDNDDSDGVFFGRATAEENKIVFVAPGQGSQWVGMARELHQHDPVFRQAFEECDSAIFAETGWRLSERLLGPDAEKYLSRIDVIQPALFVMSVALAAVWQAWGVKPDVVVGHSMGEVAAAHIAGILNLSDAVAVICRRSRLMKTLRSSGGMASVELPLDRVQDLLQSSKNVSIAASNGPNTTIISGDSNAVEALLKELEAKEIYCRRIKVDVASHSAQVDPILDQLLASLKDIRPKPATIPMLSTVTGEYALGSDRVGTVMDAKYWVRNLRSSVLFAPAIQKLSQDGHDTFIELSPHPILLPSIEASARAVSPQALAVASLRREKPEPATMLGGLATFYAAGRKVAWGRLYSTECQCVPLPQYPFQRERCWPEPADPARARVARHSQQSPLLGHTQESSLQPGTFLWESDLEIAALPYLGDHRVLRSAVFPAAGHIDMALSAARSLQPDENFEVRNASFVSAAYIPDQGGKTFQTALTPDGNGGFSFEIRTRADEGEAPWPLRSRGILQRIDAASNKSTDVTLSELQTQYGIHRDAEDHYGRTAKSGLQYGPAFQLVQEAWVGEGESLCRLRNDSETESGSVIHPTILDCCFQAMAHVKPKQEAFQAEATYLPVAIDQVRLYHPIPNDGDLFAQATLVSADPHQGTFRANMRLLDPEGRVLMDVSGMELKRVAQQSLTDVAEPLYCLEWLEDRSGEKAEQAEKTLALLPQASAENWILFADSTGIADAMKTSLEYVGGRCTLVRAGAGFRKIGDSEFQINPDTPKDLERLLEEVAIGAGVPTAVVHLWTLDNGLPKEYEAETLIRAQVRGTQQIPGIVQAIAAANWQNPPRLWLVSAGAITVDGSDQLSRIENAPLWGIGRAVAREHEELHPTLVDLSSKTDPSEARTLTHLISQRGKEDRIALRGDKRYIARLKYFSGAAPKTVVHPLADGEEYRLEISSTGIIDNIELRSRAHLLPGDAEITVEVAEAGLNFSDVTKVMGLFPGLIPGEPIPLGNEAVGKVIAVGKDVSTFRVGDEVIALSPSVRTTGMMASSVSVPAELAVHKPAPLSIGEAATVAVVYLTAYWSLVAQACIRKGEWVLIHAGAGGVGLAAIEIARWAGANIIATVGSKEKEDYLRSLGIQHVLNSRSLTFAAGVMEITGGRGVDIVLNSLAGEFLLKGLEVLAPYGRFVEMGKRDIYEDKRVGLKVLRNNISFHVVDVAAALEDRRPYVAELLQEVMRHIESGEWRPLPVQTFSSAEPSAPFHFMAQARHIGKISIRMERNVQVLPATDQSLFSANATYIITGGLGGVALTVAEWMAGNGAGHLMLLSRRTPSEESLKAIDRITMRGAAWGTTVTALKADITREADLADVLRKVHATGYPLKGIMHAAAVVDDALIRDLSPERFLSVFAPKLTGTWNLHAATLQEELDFFVLFSSIAAVHPQPGMGSYAAANAFLDAFAQYRRSLGKPAISINWGGWDQIGLARAAGTGRSIEGYEQQGMRNFSGQEALAALHRAMETNPVQVVAAPFDGDKFAEFYGPNNVPIVFSNLVSRSNAAAEKSERSEILEQLIAADSTLLRREILEAYLQEVLGRVLKLATRKIDRERPLGSMGLDSLMGLEFVRRLSQSLQIAVPATVVFNYPTIRQLATHLLRRMQLEISEEPAITVEVSHDWHALNGKRQSGSAPAGSKPMDELSHAVSEEDALQALMGNEQRSS